MVRIDFQIDLSYDVAAPGADFVFNIHAARTASQSIESEKLDISQPIARQVFSDPVTGNRYLRLRAAAGPLRVAYAASVNLTHHCANPAELAEVPVSQLPAHAIRYLFPSRYCQSDRLIRLAIAEFGSLPQGYGRVEAIRAWVNRHVTFRQQTSNPNTSAVDTLVERVGVCRDFAHLMIALCRAVNIPARFVTSTDYGADPSLGPPDFHAYVEVFIGERWYIFDPSEAAVPMGCVRLGTGRDAADVAFATIFGTVKATAPVISTKAVVDMSRGLILPERCTEALSTDSGSIGEIAERVREVA